jgi:hypothetical protein
MKATEDKSVLLLRHHLKALRLPTIGAECEKVAQRAAADNVDHLTYLLQLLEVGPNQKSTTVRSGARSHEHTHGRPRRVLSFPLSRRPACVAGGRSSIYGPVGGSEKVR